MAGREGVHPRLTHDGRSEPSAVSVQSIWISEVAVERTRIVEKTGRTVPVGNHANSIVNEDAVGVVCVCAMDDCARTSNTPDALF